MPDIIDRLIREEQELEENKRVTEEDEDMYEEAERLAINND